MSLFTGVFENDVFRSGKEGTIPEPEPVREELDPFLMRLELWNTLETTKIGQTNGLWSKYAFDYNYDFVDLQLPLVVKLVENDVTVAQLTMLACALNAVNQYTFADVGTLKVVKQNKVLYNPDSETDENAPVLTEARFTFLTVILEHEYIVLRQAALSDSKIYDLITFKIFNRIRANAFVKSQAEIAQHYVDVQIENEQAAAKIAYLEEEVSTLRGSGNQLGTKTDFELVTTEVAHNVELSEKILRFIKEYPGVEIPVQIYTQVDSTYEEIIASLGYDTPAYVLNPPLSQN